MQRWLVVLGALLVQVCLGAIYAWGTFVPMLKASRAELALMVEPDLLGIDPQLHANWMAMSKASKKVIAEATGSARSGAQQSWSSYLKDEVAPDLQVEPELWARYQPGFSGVQAKAIFSTALAVFALVMIFSGRVQDRVGPRPVAMAGCALLAIGYGMASLNVSSFPWVLGWIGVVGGAGIGCAYVCPIAACIKWFPGSKGPITGLAVAGFGAGAYLFVNLAGSWAGWLQHGGLPMAFRTMGWIFLLVGGLGASLLANPPSWTAAGASGGDLAGSGPDLEPRGVLGSTTFWLAWMAFVLASGAGLMVIGALKDFAVNEGGLSSGRSEQALGLLALFNGLGRITWGSLAQRWGVRTVMIALMGLQMAMLAALPSLGSNVTGLALGGCWVGFQFGGCLATFPLLTAERFGVRHLGGNYGLMFTAYGVGGIVGPLLAGGLWDWFGSYGGAFWAASGACLLASALIAGIPRSRTA
ncbi:MAG: MFS transporter [Isosphaeraceae bacterium]